ncbi:hypothetical protein ZHAS_00002031 [Anopheles sinensis]|uniref:Uncharacterized protein n=1 Tax=Anopheles sinensis TaxID=74873 RepID=A0A084VBQ7_ANOSI|nr:hypothetical protein ZHAS_00002031 [Anopheles sinensis]
MSELWHDEQCAIEACRHHMKLSEVRGFLVEQPASCHLHHHQIFRCAHGAEASIIPSPGDVPVLVQGRTKKERGQFERVGGVKIKRESKNAGTLLIDEPTGGISLMFGCTVRDPGDHMLA